MAIFRDEKKMSNIGFLLISVLYFLRLIFLEADPIYSWLCQQYVLDEIAYHEIALKIGKYGWIALLDGTIADISLANAKTLFIPNLLVALCIRIFGNNFWGLRIVYVILGYIVLVLLYQGMKLISDKTWIHFSILLIYVFDFHFFLQTRSAMTVVCCTFAVALLVFAMMKTRGKAKWFILGFVPITYFNLIYMGLPFVAIWAVFYFIVCMLWEKEERKNGWTFLVGIIASVILCEAISIICFKQHFVDTITDTLYAHSGKLPASDINILIGQVLQSTLSYPTSFQYSYDFLLLFLTLVSVIFLFYIMVKNQDKVSFLLLSLLGVHYAQTIFLNQLTESKATITFYPLLLSIAYTFEKYKEVTLQNEKIRKIFKYLFCMFVPLSYWLVRRSYQYGRAISDDLRHLEYIVMLICMIPLLVSIWKESKKWFIVPFTGNLLIGVIFCIYYGFSSPSYDMSNMMIDIGERTNHGVLLNGLCFSLYNDCTDLVNIYDHYKGKGYDFSYVTDEMKKAVYEQDELYCVFTSNQIGEWCISYLNDNLFADTPYMFVEVTTYTSSYTDDPGWQDMYNLGLYKKVER
ncbi:MAG: hypothetical protein J6K37_00675 [Lachnospiraceae bacterium]|nr:hypothetical protein [Lachnospiraceae bacterium]